MNMAQIVIEAADMVPTMEAVQTMVVVVAPMLDSGIDDGGISKSAYNISAITVI